MSCYSIDFLFISLLYIASNYLFFFSLVIYFFPYFFPMNIFYRVGSIFQSSILILILFFSFFASHISLLLSFFLVYLFVYFSNLYLFSIFIHCKEKMNVLKVVFFTIQISSKWVIHHSIMFFH